MGPAAAANGSGYKALVCVFLYGGNDAYNTLLATDTASWTAYTAARAGGAEGIGLAAPGTAKGQGPLHARLGGVLPINPINSQGRTVAVHPAMGAARDLFASQRLAFVSNVGPLLGPTTK
jgi:uncharacterized protein (DUF1501 family)